MSLDTTHTLFFAGKFIGMHATINGTGAVSGVSRLVFAAGQAVGPYASLGLYSSVAMWAPWACLASLSLGALLSYLLLGVNLLSDHEWSTTRIRSQKATPKATPTATRKAETHAEAQTEAQPVVESQMSR